MYIIEKLNKTWLLKTTALILSAVVLLAAVWFFISRSGAWLVDKGKWSDTSYIVGNINYLLLLNNKNINLQDTVTYDAAVPIIGGVKINDSSGLPTTDPHYQQYAEENFNEGVTVVHIQVVNDSDFAISMNISLEFDGLFDDTTDSNDIFYLVLPSGYNVNTTDLTVVPDVGNEISYKNYIKSCFGTYSTYAQMKQSLSAYYTANPGLTQYSQTVLKNTGTNENPSAGSAINVDILVWSEYDELPFVNNGLLVSEVSDPSGIEGFLQVNMSVSQRTS